MKHIQLFEDFLNEGFKKFADLENAIRHHEDGNPYYDRTKLINIYNCLKSSDQTKAKNKWSDIFGVAEAQVNEAKGKDLIQVQKLDWVDHTRLIKFISKEFGKLDVTVNRTGGYTIDPSDLSDAEVEILLDYLKSQKYLVK